MDIIKEIKNQLGDDIEVFEVNKVSNNGRGCKGYCVRKAGAVIAPTIYYNAGWDDEKIVQHIVTAYRENEAERAEIMATINAELKEVFGSEDSVYDKVYPALVSAENNEGYLKDKVWIPFFSLAVIFKVDIACGIITITKDTAQKLGLDTDILYEKAVKNIGKSYRIKTYADAVKEVAQYTRVDVGDIFDDVATEMRILTNRTGCFGAAAILSNKAMEALHDEFRADELYLLPSSVHEMIVVPAYNGEPSGLLCLKEIKELVKSVNTEVVDEQEILTDKIYIHTANGQIEEV